MCSAEWSGWQEGLASLGFVDVWLQPILAGLRFVVTVDGGASAFVSDGPAPAARGRSRRMLAVAPMTNHDWPSSLLLHGFASDFSLRATFRWAENRVLRGCFACIGFLSTSLLSPFHSCRVEPAFLVTTKGSNVSVSTLFATTPRICFATCAATALHLGAFQLRDDVGRWLLPRSDVASLHCTEPWSWY